MEENLSLNIFVVTGLGKIVSDLFVSALQNQLDQQFQSAKIYPRFVNANDIIPILHDGRRIAEMLLHVVLSPDDKLPDILLIPCNSVHISTPQLKLTLDDSFVPIDYATISLIERDGRQGRFLILGTSTTVESSMYQNALRRLGFESVVLPPRAQASFDDFIFKELVNGEMTASHLHAFRDLESQYMRLLGAEHVILACTELCYLVQVFSTPLACEVDSLQALHNAGIERLQIILRDRSNYAN